MKTVVIYVNPQSDATKQLMAFIADNIDEINKRVNIKRVLVTKDNFTAIQQSGIQKTPTLVFEGKQYIGAQKIMRILKPPSAHRDNFGAASSPEEMVQKYMAREALINPNEDEDDNAGAIQDSQLRQKMSAFEKRRAEMIGGSHNPVSRPKPGKGGKQKAKTFDTDEDFIGSVDRGEDTPTDNYQPEEDGALIWENELNMLADQMGRKVSGKISKRH